MVAGIAAGRLELYPGVAKNAPLVDVRVASSLGEAKTSDIVAAVDWMIANKSRYNIRVANFSLAGTSEASFRFDPLDKAGREALVQRRRRRRGGRQQRLGDGPGEDRAPGNDPFIITVGAIDTEGHDRPDDDSGPGGRRTGRRRTAS